MGGGVDLRMKIEVVNCCVRRGGVVSESSVNLYGTHTSSPLPLFDFLDQRMTLLCVRSVGSRITRVVSGNYPSALDYMPSKPQRETDFVMLGYLCRRSAPRTTCVWRYTGKRRHEGPTQIELAGLAERGCFFLAVGGL